MEVDQFTTAEERADENEVLLEKELKQANQTLNDCINYFTEFAHKWNEAKQKRDQQQKQHKQQHKKQKVHLEINSQDETLVEKNILPDSSYTELEDRLKTFEDCASSDGLETEQLSKLVRIVLHPSFGEKVSHRLLYHLIPRGTVPTDSVINLMGIFGALPAGAVYMVAKSTILKWILLVYDWIEPKDTLHKLYTVFFHYLEYESLRPYLCHILYRLTRREDVAPFRIRRLHSLLERAGEEPYLTSLLILYKEYYNDMVYVSKSKKRLAIAALFKDPDRKWHNAITKVQLRHNAAYVPHYHPLGFAVQNQGLSTVQKERLRKRPISSIESTSAVPGTATLLDITAQERHILQQKQPLVTLEQISSIEEFANNLESIKLPNHLASVINNRLLQHFISLQPNRGSLLRISHWLSFVLTEEFSWNDQAKNALQRNLLLQSLATFTSFTQETVPIFETFLAQFLRSWDAKDNVDETFQLLSRIHPVSFEELYTNFLRPLNNIFFVSSAVTKAKMINCFTDLLQNWVSINWKEFLSNGSSSDDAVTLRSSKSYIFTEIEEKVDHCKTIAEYIKYVDHLSLLGLQQENDHPLLQHYALSFFEVVAQLNTKFHLPLWLLPSSALMARFMLSSSAMPISRVCAILVNSKAEFEKLKVVAADFPQTISTAQTVDVLNSYIWSLCTVLWQNKLFVETKEKRPGVKDLFELRKEIVAYFQDSNPDLSGCLSLTQSYAFASLAYEYLKYAEKRVGLEEEHILNPFMIKDNIKAHYIEFLRVRGFDGLNDFLYTFIYTLASRATSKKT